MKLIGVHSGSFHADDALSVATLLQLFPQASVVRTRDEDVMASCDILVDVGGEYSPVRERYDHHQKGFSVRRENGIPYASAGLVWLEYGELYVKLVCPQLAIEEIRKTAREVDERLLQFVDAIDSGVAVDGPVAFGLSGIIDTLNATWQDAPAQDDERFAEAVSLAGTVLRHLVASVAARRCAVSKVRAGELRAQGRVLVLPEPRLPYDTVVCSEMPDVLFVVYPESQGQQYQVRVVPKALGTFVARKDLPAAWAGLRDEGLARVTGVFDSVFCHNGRFICGAQSLAGAVRMAELAVEALP